MIRDKKLTCEERLKGQRKKNREDWERGDCDNTLEFYIKKVLQR